MKRLWLGVALLWGACGDDDRAARDAGRVDAATADRDAAIDGAVPDGSTDDGGSVDASVDAAVDAAASDAGSDAGWPALPTPLGPLPAPTSALLDRFQTSQTCATCHQWSGAGSLEDASGRDVSQYTLWRSSVMALSARDPYFLAALSHEIEEHPEATDTIEATCTRCHAGAGSVETGLTGEHITFEALTTATDPVATISREGVTCTVCQLDPRRGPRHRRELHRRLQHRDEPTDLRPARGAIRDADGDVHGVHADRVRPRPRERALRDLPHRHHPRPR
ncbi:MAG: hypothetical protein KC619_30430 [Myxococcales bacterium]|nr:hypothetical protein [Myxococcales bacterium]